MLLSSLNSLLEKLLVYKSLSMTPFLLLAVAFLIGIFLYRHGVSRPPNFPPGPPRLPIWGSLWLFFLINYTHFYKSIRQMAKKYKTNVMGFYLGKYRCVAACDHESVNELLRRQEFQARPDFLLARVRSLGQRYGIIFSDGPDWVEQRRFFLRQMRDFGFGRRFDTLEAVMQEEVTDLLELLHGNWKDEFVMKEDKVLLSHLFAPYCLNPVWFMFGGERHPRGKHGPLHEVSQAGVDFMRNMESTGSAVSLTPWLQYLSPSGFGVKAIAGISARIIKFMKKYMKEHQGSYMDAQIRDYMDVYIKQIKSEEQEAKSEVFHEKQLLLVGVDVLVATSTALVGSITGVFNCLIHFPEVQKKVQAEIDEVVGRGRLATLDDRQRMPYLEATIREGLRRVTVLALSVPHLCTEDTHFRGYFIPKDTIMYSHLNAAHMDPDVWGDPENFRPERFLDEDGMLVKKDLSTPFGAGKRLCPGETFARQMMFLLTAGILQNFSLVPADPANTPPYDTLLSGLTLAPADIWAKVTPRN